MSKLSFLLVSALMLLGSTLQAEGIYLGYCDGILGTSNVIGLSGNNVTIQCAIHLTPAMIQTYTSGQITSVHAGLAEGSNYYPTEITGWVRADKEGENLASGTVSAAAGWNLIPLDNAVGLGDYSESGIWVGFSFVQSRKMNVIPFGLEGDPIEDTGWVAKGNNWTDNSEFGVLPIEAVVQGNALPMRDLTIVSAEATPYIVKLGNDVKLTMHIRNNALTPAVNPVINYSIGDAVSGQHIVQQTLDYRDKALVTFSIPTTSIAEPDDYRIHVELAWADGIADEAMADNEAEVPVTLAPEVFYKNMLVEEGTGSWCGFCVRGIVGLRTMKEKYPDRFIGLSIHNRDEYVVSSYDDWLFFQSTSYPCCLIDRDGTLYDPSAEFLEEYMLEKEPLVSNVGICLEAAYSNGTIRLDSEVRFTSGVDAVSYNIVYVLVEDQLPINQSNYYTNNAYGEMGGFENLPAHVDIIIDDVVRDIFPGPAGFEAIRGNVVSGEVYTHSTTQNMPTFSNASNVYAVAFIVDNVTGAILNATKTESIQGLIPSEGIEQIATDKGKSPICYNLTGTVRSKNSGLLIYNGKTIFVK